MPATRFLGLSLAAIIALPSLASCATQTPAVQSSASLATSDAHPNFLFIAIDDLKPILGHLSEEPGNFLQILYPDAAKRAEVRKVLSPNFDKLAAQAVEFRRAYAPAPLCNPCRTALMTGIRTSNNGIYGNQDQFRQSEKPFVSATVTLSQNLKNQGYYTAGSGKIFHTASVQTDKNGVVLKDWPDQANSWHTWINAIEDDGGMVKAHTDNSSSRHSGKTTLSPWSLQNDLFSFGVKDCATEEMPDYETADLISRILETGSATVTDRKMRQEKTITLSSSQPFFLACGIFRPHLPWIVPQEYLDLFKAEDIQITREYMRTVADDLKDLAPTGLNWTERPTDDGAPGKGRFSDMMRQGLAREPKDGDLIAWRESIRHYLASIAFADRCIGRLLSALENSPHRDNTVVVLWSDHGWELGAKFRMGKDSLWEESTNCVLMIRDPRQPAAAKGTPCYAPVSLQDLYRTIATRASLSTPAWVDGRDLNSLVLNPATPFDEIALSTRGARNHALRDPNFRYIRYGDDPANAELYDHRTDPRDMRNLINDPASQKIRTEMNTQLDKILTSGPFPYDTGKPAKKDEDSTARRKPSAD